MIKIPDKFEIYPYHRITETIAPSSRMGRKPALNFFKNWKWKNRISIPLEIMAMLKAVPSWENFLLALGAVIMARAFVLGDLLPFIYAYSAAFGEREKSRSLLLSLFGILSFITVLNGYELWANILTLILLTGVINSIKIPLNAKWWPLPLLTASVILLSKSILMIFTEFSFYNEMVVVFEAVIAGVLTFVFLVAGDVLSQKKPLVNFSFEDIASFLILGIGIVMGLNDIHVAGLSVSSIICRLGILVAAFVWGCGGGTMVGVMTGILPSVSSSIFAQTLGMYAVSGLLAGLFRNFGRLGVIIGFMLGTMALSMFISETRATIVGIWETGIACLIFITLPASLKEKFPFQTLGPIAVKEQEMQALDARIKETARSRIEHLATVFDELSSTFASEMELKRRNKSGAWLNYLYDQISQEFCVKCSRYQSCWGKECYETSQQILDIFTMAETGGELDYEKCPREFKRHCLHAREMIKTINYLFDRLRINEYWAEKLDESRDLVSAQLKGVSQVIKDLAEEMDIGTELDLNLRQNLLRESKRLGLHITDFTPLRSPEGQLRLNVMVDSCPDGEYCESTIAPALSGILGEKMKVGEKKCPRFKGKGQCEICLLRTFSYKVLTGAVQVGKEEVCGDSFTIASLKEGKELIALSDGMGVGEKASGESQATVRLLELLLNSGFDREVALNTINSVLLLRSDTEVFATLDMVMIDLYNAQVDFIKVGSAPSFIRRGAKIGAVVSNSLPIGIMDNIDVVSEKRSLYPRDMLVMVSDGVMEASRKIGGEQWIPELLASAAENDPQRLAEMIINRALGMCKGKPADDMTVICIYVDLA
ncbi:MAG: stage II sporulation protein E [Syntrophomonas sp.]